MSILPALMFFQFDREKLTTLVDRWLHAIFRLDPSLRTVSDVDAKYGRRVEEFFGAPWQSAREPAAPLRNRSPSSSPPCSSPSAGSSSWSTPAGRLPLPSFQDLFAPGARPMTMAFLGAYFLASRSRCAATSAATSSPRPTT